MAGELVMRLFFRRPKQQVKTLPPLVWHPRRGKGFRYIGPALASSSVAFTSTFSVPATQPAVTATANFRSSFEIIGGDLASGRYRR